jgi:putative flippase GtrA
MIKRYILQLLNFVYPLVKKLVPFQVYAYLAVGAANTMLNIALFAAFYWLIAASISISIAGFKLHTLAVEIATIVSFFITVITGFWLSKNFAFTGAGNEKKEKAKQFGKYFLVSLQGQFSDYLITKGLIVLLQVNPVLAYLISTFIMLTINYFLQKYYTFKAKNPVAAS